MNNDKIALHLKNIADLVSDGHQGCMTTLSGASKLLLRDNDSAFSIARGVERSAIEIREHAEHLKILADTLDYLKNCIRIYPR